MNSQKKNIYQLFDNTAGDAANLLGALLELETISAQIAEYADRTLASITEESNIQLAYDRQCAQLLDRAIVEAYQKNPDNKEAADELLLHLRLLAVATGNELGMELYDEATMNKILSGLEKDYEELRFIHTLRQAVFDNDRHTMALTVFAFFPNIDPAEPISVADALILMLKLDILWKDFGSLPDVAQAMLLTTFTYQSIVMGVPVEEGIKDALYFTTTAFIYFLLCQRFYEYFTASAEQAPLSSDGKNAQPFGAVLLTHTDRAGDAAGEKARIQAFVEDVYSGQPKAARVKEWLVKTMELYFAIKEARLIEKTLGGETSDADVYENEMKQLIQFFFDPKTWPKIAAYYKKPKPLVSVENFLHAFPKGIDLGKDNAPGFLAEFSEFLHAERLLPKGTDLVEFHEKDGTFHWNQRFE